MYPERVSKFKWLVCPRRKEASGFSNNVFFACNGGKSGSVTLRNLVSVT